MKLNYKRTIFIGFAFFAIIAFWQFYDNEIPKILKYTFGLGETATGAVMAMDNVLALFLLPVFGTLSDKTETKIGKRMPYIIIGTVLSIIFLFVLIAVARNSGSLLLFIGILLLLLISMGIFRSPAVSLMPDLTPAPVRSSANAIINLMGTLGGIYVLVMTKLLLVDGDNPAAADYMPFTLSVIICMAVGIGILVLKIKENAIKKEIKEEGGLLSLGDELEEGSSFREKTTVSKEVEKSLRFLLVSVFLWYTAYNAVTTAFSRFVVEVWDMRNGDYATCLLVATVAATLSYVPIAYISGEIGRKKTILIGIVIMATGYITAGLFPSFSFFINICFVMVGIGWATINVNSYPMVVEMCKAGDIGKFTGLYYTFSMAAQVFTPIFSGFLLEHISYKTLFPYSFIFSVLAFMTMLMVKHGDTRPDKKKSILENFDIDD
ncbi:MFS transporter [Butyrivibrio sp. X503]|uniref:MFS transporter n=1 Tax=Butyrivibrio sp. X503 TaxID=2364878 RepID=UPI000EA8BB6D|nr:MFS transporter [Butyrivibrio sp. X503]RKM57320.1 MFS transporter [Butyrivibrio sp. X503]